MAPQSVRGGLVHFADSLAVHKDPLGLVLVIGAYNYPVQLLLSPLAGAIAAGNCAIIKPSELPTHTAALIGLLFPKYMDQNAFRCVNGGIPETTEILSHRFDHIFYTGSSMVAKVITQAAAKHLTPVTLELGGKSPCLVDENSNLATVAKRIAYGKLINSGQTCIAPDYIICTKETQEKLVPALKEAIESFFGLDIQTCTQYSRIINLRHVDRLQKMLGGCAKELVEGDATTYGGDISFGGKVDREDRYFPPTIVKNVGVNSLLMKEEIFGPILPIVVVDNVLTTGLDMLREGDAPLALYIFSKDKNFIQKCLNDTKSGGVCINDTIMHQVPPNLPFGGVGHSGMGRYHGKETFDTFSYSRSVLHRPHNLEFVNNVRYPPYTSTNEAIGAWLVYKSSL